MLRFGRVPAYVRRDFLRPTDVVEGAMARRSAAVGWRPTVIQIPSGSRTLAIHPSVVAGRYLVRRPPARRRRR
jgi:hypothetical protein